VSTVETLVCSQVVQAVQVMKICNELVKKVKKYVFSDTTQGGQIWFLQGAGLSWKKAKKSQSAKRKFWDQQAHAKFWR